MSVSPRYQALKTLASLSIDEEFCQKIGGMVFRPCDDMTPVYQNLCRQFSLLIDEMVEDLHALKGLIPPPCGKPKPAANGDSTEL